MSGSDGVRGLSPEAIARLAAACEAAEKAMQGRDPVAEYRSVRRLARDLGMPRDAVPMYAPPEAGDRLGARWAGWRVEMFGQLVSDGPPITEPMTWPGYQGGPGPISGERLNEIWGDSLPVDERARMVAGRPALNIRAWQIIVRRAGIAAHIEARRGRVGTWDVSIRNLGPKPTAEDVRDLLPGLGLIRRQITRAGGRPRGRGKVPETTQRAAVAKYRRATGTAGLPPAKWLAPELAVSKHTAEKYLRGMKTAK